MNPKLSYLVCSTPRTGSTLLCEGLKRIGHCGLPHEYLNPAACEGTTRVSRNGGDLERGLKEILAQGTTSNGVFGMKIHWIDFQSLMKQILAIEPYRALRVPEALSRVFPNLRYIHIRRRDKIRQAVSHAKAFSSNIWVVGSGQTMPYSAPLRYDYFSICERHQAILQEDAAWERFFRTHSIRPLEIFYEDLAEGYGSVLKSVLQFLGIQAPPGDAFPSPPLRRLANETDHIWYERYSRTPVCFRKGYTALRLMRRGPFVFFNYAAKKLAGSPLFQIGSKGSQDRV
jgi:LPS sulfotransferase NodH